MKSSISNPNQVHRRLIQHNNNRRSLMKETSVGSSQSSINVGNNASTSVQRTTDSNTFLGVPATHT